MNLLVYLLDIIEALVLLGIGIDCRRDGSDAQQCRAEGYLCTRQILIDGMYEHIGVILGDDGCIYMGAFAVDLPAALFGFASSTLFNFTDVDTLLFEFFAIALEFFLFALDTRHSIPKIAIGDDLGGCEGPRGAI